jgi:hypothetical protein
MKLEKYNISSSDTRIEFQFVSTGKKGDIVKVVQYSPTGLPGVYNLAFGDKDPKTGEISDTVISDNGDSQKVLATVSETALMFLDSHPSCQIFATGLTKARTRLYQRGIANNLEVISQTFEIKGLIGVNWHVFKKGVNYDAFLINKK